MPKAIPAHVKTLVVKKRVYIPTHVADQVDGACFDVYLPLYASFTHFAKVFRLCHRHENFKAFSLRIDMAYGGV